MANLEGMKYKFIVIKRDDADKYLGFMKTGLNMILQDIADGREKEGKLSNNTYLVINTDEPYADEVIEILKRNGHWG